MTDLVIFDIDGTLADITHRLHFIKGEGKKDWDAFHAACVEDTPIPEIIMVAQTIARTSHQIVLMTGRMDTVRSETVKWLDEHEVPLASLYMRKAGDYRPDHEIKRQFLAEIRSSGFTVILAFDDRQQVVDMWRSEGIRCCQVAPGDF